MRIHNVFTSWYCAGNAATYVRQRVAQNVLKLHDFQKIQKSKVDLHTTFTCEPTEKLITSEYACLEAIQLFFQTFFDIVTGIENISI